MNARCVKIIFTMLVMFALAGCAEKVKLVQLGAEQFAAQSKAAIAINLSGKILGKDLSLRIKISKVF